MEIHSRENENSEISGKKLNNEIWFCNDLKIIIRETESTEEFRDLWVEYKSSNFNFFCRWIFPTMVDTQHFCLRWNNYQSSITSAFENLRDDEDFVDVTLACDGKSLKAHRVVLSACSPYFRELLKVSEYRIYV